MFRLNQKHKRMTASLVLLSYLMPPIALAAPEDSCKDLPPPPVVQDDSIAPACDSRHISEAASFVRRRTTLMKIAGSKADFKNLNNYMTTQKGSSLIGLKDYLDKTCQGDASMSQEQVVAQVCDTDCFLQMASTHYFNMSDLPWLDEKGNVINMATDSIGDSLTEALTLIDRAQKNLAIADRGNFEAPTNGGKPTAVFNRFLKDSARLNILKTRLLIAAGDIYYQNESATRAKTLRAKISNALTGSTVATKPGQEDHYAETYYEQASWTVQEALIDLPSTNSLEASSGGAGESEASFGKLRFDLDSLRADVQKRLNSVRNGHLFLNINPEDFPAKSSSELLSLLQGQLAELASIEGKIGEIVTTWQKGKSEAEQRQIDLGRMQDDRSLELKGLQISQLEEFAGQVTQKFNTLIQKNVNEAAMTDGEIDMHEKQMLISNLQFEHKKLQKEVADQINTIKKQNETDLTVLQKEARQEQRDHYKWLIEKSMTTLNLDMQISQLNSQIGDLALQIDMKQAEIAGYDANINSKKALKKAEEARILEIGQLKGKLEGQKTELFESNRKMLVQGICAIAVESARLGTPLQYKDCPSVTVSKSEDAYLKDAIAFQTEFATKAEEMLKKVRDCVGGKGICTGLTESQVSLANRIYAAKKKELDDEKQMVTDLQNELKNQIENIDIAIASAGTFQGLSLALTAAAGFYVAAAGKKGGFIGPFPVGEFDLGEQAKAGYEVAKDALHNLIDITRTQSDFSQAKSGLVLEMTNLKTQMKHALTKIEIEEIAKQRTLAELAAADVVAEKDQFIVISEAKSTKARFEKDSAQLPALVAKLKAEFDSNVAKVNSLEIENRLLNFDSQAFDLQIEAARARIDSLDQEIAQQTALIKVNSIDVQRMNKLSDDALAQSLLVKQTKSQVDYLNNSVAVETSIINDLRDKQKNQMTALSADQIEHLKAVLVDNSSQTTKTIAMIEAQKELIEKKNLLSQAQIGLLDSMSKDLTSIQDQVKAKRCEMISMANRPVDKGEDKALFIATEDMISQLTKGVPEYIRAKKERIEYVNYLFNLYRNRVVTLQGLAGPVAESAKFGYIRTSDDLQKAVSQYCTTTSTTSAGTWVCDKNSLAFNNDSVTVHASEFVIPPRSGLMSELLSKGRARFEITPNALKTKLPSYSSVDIHAALALKGFYELWHPVGMDGSFDMSLVNISTAATFPDKSCENAIDVRVRHLGTGSRFLPLSESSDAVVPYLSVTAPRYDDLPLFNAGPSQLEDFRKYFSSLFDSYKVNDFPEEIDRPNGSTTSKRHLRYLGAPLVGTYEISLNVNKPGLLYCLDNQSLSLGFAYTANSKK